jgi:ABC-type transport system substrate-binding protein
VIHAIIFIMTLRFVTSSVLRFLFVSTLFFVAGSSTFAAPLTVQLSSEPTQFDPLLLEDGTALKISANTIGTLFQYDGKGERSKALIDSYSVSRDRKHYTFKFRKGLKWSDGKAFSAEHFLLAVTRVVKEPVKAALTDLFPKIDLAHCRVIDSRTMELVLVDPDMQLLNWLTLPPFAPIRQDIVDAYKEKRTPSVPTLGAYEIVDYKREEFLSLKKNESYYDAASVSIPEVKIRFVGDEGALVPLLKAGTLDILNKVPMLQLKQVEEIARVASVPVEAVTYLAFNTRKPPFNDVNNRQLFRDALTSKRAELAQILKTGELPAKAFLPAILAPNGLKPVTQKDPKPTDEKLEFSIQSDSGSRNQTILEYVQSELKDRYRWKANLDLIDWKTHYAKLKTDPDAVYRFGWQNPVSDPYVMYQVLTTKSPNNFTGWSNGRYDALVDSLRQESRNVKKLELIQDLETILYEEAPVVPLLHQVLRFAYSKRVSGFRANPFGVILFRELHLNDTAAKVN